MHPSLPSAFISQTVSTPEGADIFVRSGGSGPVVVLLHGYGETSDSWAPLAADLVKSYTVVVPDLRGIGRSSRPPGGYDKKTQAADIRSVKGRERIYLDRIWNDFTGDPTKPDEATRAYYAAQYAEPGAMRAGFAQFTALRLDTIGPR